MEHSSKGKSSISTHAPLAGRDRKSHSISYVPPVFQPTRPLRGATKISLSDIEQSYDFNPRAPCGARLKWSMPERYMTAFQPTRPLRGATQAGCPIGRTASRFQPTRPLRGATLNGPKIAPPSFYFNPRAPCGARLQKCTNHYAHFCDNRQISDAFAQNADCQGILFLFDAGKPCGFWVRTAQVISARLCFAL